MPYALCFLWAIITLLPSFAHTSFAAQWEPTLHDVALPTRIVAVDKKNQQFYLYEKKSPLALSLTYPCTTGQIEGDKQRKNDKRTPEGVYFVDYKIASGLDFKEYGGIAYTLNYPNPVDKLRGKTGYGIWIHSKGEPIEPRITRGCIAIDLEHIAEVGPKLTPGTAVVVGETFSTETVIQKNSSIAKHLRMRMEQWTRAWASRSDAFFDFYDTEAYSKAMPETFTAFRKNKERWFKRLNWINIFNREVHVLEGPGYWVTWADQFYRAPNLSTEGVRRLYWQQDADKVFRIVGMEWIPRNVGMQVAYEKGQLVASTGRTLTDAAASVEAPTAPPVSMPETGDEEIKSVAAASPLLEKKPGREQGKIMLTEELRNTLQNNIQTWAKYLKQGNAKALYAMYDTEKYGTLDFAKGRFSDVQKMLQPYINAAWLDIMQGQTLVQVEGNTVLTQHLQLMYKAGKKPVEGKQIFCWQRDAKGNWRIVGSVWKEESVNMQVAYLEKISYTIDKVIENWLAAWSAAHVEKYMQFYAPNASQGGKRKAAIQAQKTRLWENAAPKDIQLRGLRVQINADGVRADMTQVYTDVNGKGDKGTKTLLLHPIQGEWLIVKEDWQPLAPLE